MEEALRIFNIEATELLEEMEASLIRLEGSPGDQEAINSIFRAAHTIKGSAGIVGLDGIRDFTHRVESLLEHIRSGHLQVTPETIELLFECRDHISSLVAEAAGQGGGEETGMSRTLSLKLTQLSGETTSDHGAQDAAGTGGPTARPSYSGVRVSASDNWHISLRFGPDVLRNGMDPISFISYMEKLGSIVHIKTLWDAMPPTPEMDPESCYLGFEIDLRSVSDRPEIEGVFEFLEGDCSVRILEPRSPVSSYLQLVSSLPEDREMLEDILVQGEALSSEDLLASEDELMEEEGLLMHVPAEAGAAPLSPASSGDVQRASTIRVDIEKLDRLVNWVGELVISGASIRQEADRLRQRRLSGLADTLMRLIDEIRDSSMSVRMVPVIEIFNRFKRMVRDISHEMGKEIDLRIEGGETELDRTVIEQIKDPLVHIIRNAADHGIEPPGERAQTGKPERGTILMNAYQDTGDIVIEVTDDGRGIERDKVVREAIARGVITSASGMTEEEVFDLLFEPGFSTAHEVTSLSGRGVGMDVVKRNIQSLKGSVAIESSPGEGTTVRVRLPLTLAIIEGFLVTVGSTSFVVPMDMVQECLELTEAQREASHGRDHIPLRGHILPYLRLRSVFAIDGERPEIEHILVVMHSGKSLGLVVDRLVGEVSTVIKTLGRFYRDVPGVSGATIMGDGTVALIIDVPGLVRQSGEHEG